MARTKNIKRNIAKELAVPVFLALALVAVIFVVQPTGYAVKNAVTPSTTQTINGTLYVTGSVGVGTATPTTDFDIKKPSAKMTIYNTNAGLMQGIVFKNPVDTWLMMLWGNEFFIQYQNNHLLSLFKNGDTAIGAPSGRFTMNGRCIAIKDYNMSSYTYCKTARGVLSCSATPC